MENVIIHLDWLSIFKAKRASGGFLKLIFEFSELFRRKMCHTNETIEKFKESNFFLNLVKLMIF